MGWLGSGKGSVEVTKMVKVSACDSIVANREAGLAVVETRGEGGIVAGGRAGGQT